MVESTAAGGRGASTLSGLTEGEAKEFHSIFMTSFIGFTLVALVAHVLAWMWRPWLPGPQGYRTSMLEVQDAFMSIMPFVG